MSGGLGLEQRYRRLLRLLPGYYRQRWQEDMVAAFLDSWLTGDPYEDRCILEFCKPTWPEVASVMGLAARLYLGGAATPRRYFAWGVWSLTLALLAAVAGAYRIVTLAGYLHDPHLFKVSLAELVILVAAAALVAPDAARAQTATPAPPYPGTVAA